jgi:cytochrome c5
MSGTTSDKEFYKIFSYVSLFIIALAIIIAILSNVFASSVENDNYNKVKEKAIQERLASPEKINLASNPTFKSEVIEVSSAKSGKDIYNSVCMSCHMSGAAGAPITGKADQWSERLAKGNDTLYSNAINGIGVMPAKGGLMSLTDDEVKSAVDFMLEQSN